MRWEHLTRVEDQADIYLSTNGHLIHNSTVGKKEFCSATTTTSLLKGMVQLSQKSCIDDWMAREISAQATYGPGVASFSP